MLEIKNIVKTYKSKSGVTVKALDNVSLKFPKKGMVFILGKSGSGKSTMLNVLGGLDGFDSGEILVNGESTAYFKQAQFDSFRNTYVGFIFQEYNILDNFNVGQNIALAMQLQSRKPTSEDINKILDEVELKGLGDRKPNELSGGQKQRVAIARALVKNPQIIMADEPTGALDSNTGIQIFDVLKKLSKDKLVIIISHDREFSERYADRIIELKDGKVISDVSNVSKDKKTEVSNLVFSANEIYVKNDYVLTAKDLKEINKFLKDCKNGAKIKNGQGKFSVSARGKFEPTKEKDIKLETGGFKLIKSRLPLSRAFKMGASGLGHKKFKLGMTIVLSLVAFTMLGASATVALTDQNRAMANALASSNYSQLNLEKYKYNSNNFAGARQIFKNGEGHGLTTDDINALKSIAGDNAIELSRYAYKGQQGDYVSYQSGDINEITSKIHDYYNTPYVTRFNRFGEINTTSYSDAKKVLNDAGYTVLSTTVPSNDSQIFISNHLFNTFVINQIEIDGQTVSNYNDIVGKEITVNSTKLKVAGVFDGGMNINDSRYTSYLDKSVSSYGGDSVTMELATARDYDINSACIGFGGFFDKLGSIFGNDYERRVTTISKTHSFKSGAQNLINNLSKEFEASGSTFMKYGISNAMIAQVESTLSSLSPLRIIFLYIGLAFVIFSGLLLANFIANSISYQKKEIGILRAIGARGKDVFKIYGSEAFIIAAANFVLSCITTYIVVRFALAPQLTKITMVSILKFGILEILILLGVSFLSAFIASFIPVKKTADKKPVEAIRNK